MVQLLGEDEVVNENKVGMIEKTFVATYITLDWR